MHRPYQYLDYVEHDGVFCVRIRNTKLREDGIDELSAELARLVDEGGCRKMVLSLGPSDLDCLYSVFLAKLISLQRRLQGVGGTLALAELTENTRDVFKATGLDRHFRFFPEPAAAVQELVTGERGG